MPVQANAVLCHISGRLEALRKVMYFHLWNEPMYEVRLMCSFDLSSSDIDGFLSAIQELAELSGN